MPEELRPGSQVRTMDGAAVTVRKLLGEGGQGWVWLADWNGKDAALKWYKSESLGPEPGKLYGSLEKLVELGSPDPVFLWPLAITERQDGTFGCVMDLLPAGYCRLLDFRAAAGSRRIAAEAALRVAGAFRALHGKGCCFGGFDAGDWFFDPETGDVRVAGCDQIVPAGAQADVGYTPRWAAPEIVAGASGPDEGTDRYSMAALLFWLLCGGHPLEGKRFLTPSMTPQLQQLQTALYGTEPIFMLDPSDDRNGPHPRIHGAVVQAWSALPEDVRQLFLDTFSQKGLHEPDARPDAAAWEQALTRFRDGLDG